MDRRDLYGLPLEQFTEQRNALARRLRQEGDRERAAEVAKLRKPTVAAWAVNQLVRTQKREFDALLKAGDALQKAQAGLLGGDVDPGALREAAAAERGARERLTAKARGLLSSEGDELQPAKLEQVSDTLHAAAIEEQSRAQVRDGCVVRELRHVGLGALGAGTVRAPAPRRRGLDGRAAEQKSARDAEVAKQEVARRKAARAAEAAARRELGRVERGVRAAEERREHASRALGDADQTLATARELAERARTEHERAQRALDEF